ncbi:F-box/LRR-repeat protein At4g14096-like [Lotus japonicus]|uniref:F-box/LRR-repeat protein At4g14096-like n=1 Tax=Lotus japonicus TaxID=34305 RepID=UPI0025907921|nr:F-box/LRR-repeat protein At4g14096-like [Lotus japonicus]
MSDISLIMSPPSSVMFMFSIVAYFSVGVLNCSRNYDLGGMKINVSPQECRYCCVSSGVSIDVDGVNSLISSAVKHKIEVLKLLVHVKPLFVLPNFCSASDTLNKLVLEPHCVLDVASGIYFSSLKTLKLSCVTFANEKSVQQLFSGCPVLQKLSLCNCNWCNIKQISITTPTLKILTIFSGLSVYMNSTVKIDAVNLLYFSYTGYSMVDFVLVNLASIVDARVDCFYPLFGHTIGTPVSKLLGGLGSIKSLRLSNDTLQCLLLAKYTRHLLPMFNNLTHLHVDLGASEFTSEALMNILQKTPKLEVLHIPLICLDAQDWILNSVPCCFKYSLKLFCISHFRGRVAEVQLLKFFLENAAVLGEIWIFCSKTLSVNLKKQAEVSNQLQPVCPGTCVIKFQ